jgi:enoyl-CoA hydratase/carnithine racemase
MAEKEILYDVEDQIGIITFNRPEKMNSITRDMQLLLTDIVIETIRDTNIRVVILTGTGRAFCAGTDVSALGGEGGGDIRAIRAKKWEEAGLPPNPLPDGWNFTKIPKPVIAAINGAAVGMGAEWVAQCDFRIGSENARIGWVFTQRGLTPDIGSGPYLLPYIVGMSNALEMMYSGEIINAEEAKQIGLLSKVVPPDELMPEAKALAKKLMKGAPLAVKGVKELTYGALDWSLPRHRFETGNRFAAANLTEDCKEGIRSFREKRPPVWTGS